MSEPEPLDEFDEFESELKRLRPPRLPAELAARIAARLKRPQSATVAADRCLMGFMGAGALAASLIAGLMISQVMTDRPRGGVSPTPPSAFAQQMPPPSLGEYQQALARSNDDPTALEVFR